MKKLSKHCINCVNLKHTGRIIFNTAVYKCAIVNGIVDPTSCCDYFQEMEIQLFKKPVPPILNPHDEGFRGFSGTYSRFIKTREGQVILV